MSDMTQLPYRPCVGIMMINAAGKVFVGQRLDNQTEAWQMPQGGIDDGEDPRTAALRELGEETGVSPDLVTITAETEDWFTYDLPKDLVPSLWGGRYRGQKQKWFLCAFHGQDTQINIATKHPEFAQWKWIDADDLVSSIVPFKREVYAKVIAAFAPML